jgi:AraC-like DNA-binding protein
VVCRLTIASLAISTGGIPKTRVAGALCDTYTVAVMRYREFHTAGPLALRIECLWTLQPEASRESSAKRVFPDNCMDIYFIGDQPAMVAGPATTAYELDIPAGQAVFGLRLSPGAGGALLGCSAQVLRDKRVALEHISRDLACRLTPRIRRAMSECERHARVSEEFAHILGHDVPLDRIVSEAMRLIARTPCEPALKTTRLALEIGERQLRRRFLHALGYGPKRFMRIMRFQRLLDLVRMKRTAGDWARLALDAGYADQAHMINDVRSIAGVSPTNLGL